MRIELSKPVALNALYGTNKWGSKYIKKEGRRWQEEALWALKTHDLYNWAVPLRMEVELYTCRHQDNDSCLKILQDTLQLAGVYEDDYWIFELNIKNFKVKKPEEKLVVEIDVIQ